MTVAICRRCSRSWEAAQLARCPQCLAERWGECEAFVTAKHHPDSAREAAPDYRSVLTPHFLEHLEDFIRYAAEQGDWFFDRHYRCYVHFTSRPLGRAPGVGIPAGKREAAHALDSMLVADAAADAHVFAVDHKVVEAQIKAGEFAPLSRCDESGCPNLRDPEALHCALHGEVARALPD